MDAVQEFVIEWERGDIVAKITAPNGSWLKNRIMKLKEEDPENIEIIAENKDGSIFAAIPVRYIKIRKPREMSPAQLEQAREQLRKINESRKER